jgi:putative transferase (TIGR04331 family)
MSDCINGLSIETWKIPFRQSLADCRLYICDHLSTTFAEALVANKPTILFWNPLTNRLRPESQPYYELLRTNGILFDSPEEAAFAVNEAYADVESWWNNAVRQAAVAEFCNRFARTDVCAVALWSAEFKRIAALP